MSRHLGIAVAAACGGTDAAPIDAPSRDAPPPCDAQSLAIGRCVTDAGAACTGALDEARRFEAAAAGADVPLVVGPQGSAMLIFAVATTGIVAGDPADPTATDNPQLALIVWRSGTEPPRIQDDWCLATTARCQSASGQPGFPRRLWTASRNSTISSAAWPSSRKTQPSTVPVRPRPPAQ